ncbi:hypothetical protein GpartN1_g748.t1 [Galdieria partita]|uniref:Uncharacterized protein n=1 Tax=Galdieria partita TaxID=83374 RepID=A0A9C7PS29_9RHOD|nr:hypothetical protein GpartN1_g748.t1 [Galdieria partita]
MGTSLRSLFTSYETGAHQVKTYLNLGENEVNTESELVYENTRKGAEVLQGTLKKKPALQLVSEKEHQHEDISVSELFENFEQIWNEMKEIGVRFQRPKGLEKENVPWSKSQIRKQLKQLRKERRRKKKRR